MEYVVINHMANKKMELLELEDNLTPWNHEDVYLQTPQGRVSTNPHAIKYFKRRNYSQPIRQPSNDKKSQQGASHKYLKQQLGQSFRHTQVRETESFRKLKKCGKLFVRTMNITYNVFPIEKETQSQPSQRNTDAYSQNGSSTSHRQVTKRIHGVSVNTPIDSPSISERKFRLTDNQFDVRNSCVKKETVMRSYVNFFNPSFRKSNSCRKGVNNDRTSTKLKIMRPNLIKEEKPSKILKKTERSYLKQYLNSRRNCIF